MKVRYAGSMHKLENYMYDIVISSLVMVRYYSAPNHATILSRISKQLTINKGKSYLMNIWGTHRLDSIKMKFSKQVRDIYVMKEESCKNAHHLNP